MQNTLNRYSVGILAAAIVAGGSVAGWQQISGAEVGAEERAAVAATGPASVSPNSYADLVAKVSPAVVTIRSERIVQAQHSQMPFEDDPLFRRFFDDRFDETPHRSPDRRQGGLGSGVIVRPDGYVLTNHHVVDGADAIKVELADRRIFDAKVVGSDPPSDLAVLKIDASGLPTLPLADSDDVRVGDIALAIGNPLGVGQTVTMGMVSAKGRATGLGDGSFEDFIQTDAPINQGNSGGALVNTRGELIGINSQILSPSGGNIGIGFAIPASMAKDIMVQLIENGAVRRGMLAVTVQPVTSEIAESLSLPAVRGALVSSVQDGGPAHKAGLKRGDVIITVDGMAISDGNSLRNQIAGSKPGTAVTLGILRDGEERTLTATLGELSARAGGGEAPKSDVDGTYGMSVIPQEGGLQVTSVDPAGSAARAGFKPGDVIKEVRSKAVDTVPELQAALRETPDRPALVLVERNDAHLYLTLPEKQS